MPITNGLRNCTRCHREGRLTNSRIKIPKQPYGKGLEGSIILQEHAYGSIRCRLSDTHPWRCRNQELALFSVSLCNSLIGPFPPSAVFSLCVLILDVCFVENHDMMLDVVYFLCHALLALRACAAAATTRTERDSTKQNLHLHYLRPRRAPSRLPTQNPSGSFGCSLLHSRFGLLYFFQLLGCTTRHGQHTIFSIPKIRQNEGYKLLSTGIEWGHFHLSPPLPPYLSPLSIHNGW